LIGLSVVVAASLSATVMAEDVKAPDAVKAPAVGKPHKAERVDMFKKADANADGKLSLDEFKTMAKGPEAEKKFTAADTDKDSFLTPEELKAAKAAEHAAKKAAKEAAKAAAAVPPALPVK
jgi:Ca2+-binding EF-hand superfamily protein